MKTKNQTEYIRFMRQSYRNYLREKYPLAHVFVEIDIARHYTREIPADRKYFREVWYRCKTKLGNYCKSTYSWRGSADVGFGGLVRDIHKYLVILDKLPHVIPNYCYSTDTLLEFFYEKWGKTFCNVLKDQLFTQLLKEYIRLRLPLIELHCNHLRDVLLILPQPICAEILDYIR